MPRGKAGATSTEEVLVTTEAETGRCLRQPAVAAARNVKYPLSPREANLFIAETVLEP